MHISELQQSQDEAYLSGKMFPLRRLEQELETISNEEEEKQGEEEIQQRTKRKKIKKTKGAKVLQIKFDLGFKNLNILLKL